MAVWRLYRYRHSDGRSKDWAVSANADGTITTRWGRTAARLPGVSTRKGVRLFDIEKQKQAKGYVFVAEVEIDSEGHVHFPEPAKPDPPPSGSGALYWHIDCRVSQEVCLALASEIRRLIDVIHSLPDYAAMPHPLWKGWQRLSDLALGAEPFSQSGQIKPAHGVLPWLFLMTLKQQGFAGVEIGIATESSREVSADLKAEQEVLDFFGTDLDRIRGTAEMLGLLKPRLNLASLLSDTDDRWF
ncbi:conserved hypothetical protein [Candidatus Methylobacter favarea]|uniref:Uncharacterized protein n=1 Tax=Candidatus Methylobacter favarea TaxID=2707345 RepID=A0A8S0X170_9GAMM|nr:hypothetical protein [Candidatus Methylobacter favarea]CAA9891078.1 conserved hypothetical protein [Candidatus Methylobacter favarea]